MGSIAVTDEYQGVVNELFDEATRELPNDLNEAQAMAWTARRMLEISERQRKRKQTVQVLLSTWVVNGEMGQIWMAHPDKPETFRDFLKSVGTERDNNQLSPSTISDMVAIAEMIVPFCKNNNVPVDGYITGELWTKFREAIPVMREAVETGSLVSMKSILADVKALPSRDAVRQKYRDQRNPDEKLSTSDVIRINGKTVIVTLVGNGDLVAVKRALGKVSRWDAIAAAQVEDKLITIRIPLT
jgi:hypothetical protein